MSAEIEARVWPVVVKLEHPVAHGSQVINELVLRRGRVGDMRGVKFSGGGEIAATDLILIASRMAGQPTQVIEALDIDDAGKVMELAIDFLGRSLTAGPKPSP